MRPESQQYNTLALYWLKKARNFYNELGKRRIFFVEEMLRKNTAVTPAIDIDDIDPVAHYRKRASGKYHNCC
ncbi:hypothetical protein J6590_080190 [Homalodisca vitripennis]|nr:hypothetical protein J6590_080190 [Homalodisca vitripennis]